MFLDEDENCSAFALHFNSQNELYKHQVVISLVDQSGKEAVIHDAFIKHILKYDNPDLTFITFDFHEYW